MIKRGANHIIITGPGRIINRAGRGIALFNMTGNAGDNIDMAADKGLFVTGGISHPASAWNNLRQESGLGMVDFHFRWRKSQCVTNTVIIKIAIVDMTIFTEFNRTINRRRIFERVITLARTMEISLGCGRIIGLGFAGS